MVTRIFSHVVTNSSFCTSEESKVLQSEMKEVKPVDEMLPTKSNQNVREEVKEQKQSPITVLSEED